MRMSDKVCSTCGNTMNSDTTTVAFGFQRKVEAEVIYCANCDVVQSITPLGLAPSFRNTGTHEHDCRPAGESHGTYGNGTPFTTVRMQCSHPGCRYGYDSVKIGEQVCK